MPEPPESPRHPWRGRACGALAGLVAWLMGEAFAFKPLPGLEPPDSEDFRELLEEMGHTPPGQVSPTPFRPSTSSMSYRPGG